MPDDRLSSLPAVASSRGPVLLWHLDLLACRQDQQAALLSGDDRARLARLPPVHARRLLARRALLASAAAKHLGCRPDELRLGAGARSVTAPGRAAVHVSLSASGARGLLALAQAPVGVDLEVLSQVPESAHIARLMFSDAERTWLEQGHDAGPTGHDERFLRIWVRKEAVVKATGAGLTGGDLRDFTVDPQDREAAVIGASGRCTGLRTVGLRVPGALAALATSARPGAPSHG